MNATEYVSSLYQILLGRDPDPPGLSYWVNGIAEGRSPIDVLSGVLESAEYRSRTAQITTEGDSFVVQSLRDRLPPGTSLTVVDIGAQRLESESHVYVPLLGSGIPCHIIGFDPLSDRLKERAQLERLDCLELLPFAIGDGDWHTLHINNRDSTSSFYALDEDVISRFGDLSTLRTVATSRFRTRRLDDVLTCDKVDFLKLDIQGYELAALQSAEKTLQSTAVIHCEVEFTPIYKGQPLFFEVHRFLNDSGFIFIDYATIIRLPLIVPSGEGRSESMIFGDAVFFRNPDLVNRAMLLRQALIAFLVYRKRGLAEWLISKADSLDPQVEAKRASSEDTLAAAGTDISSGLEPRDPQRPVIHEITTFSSEIAELALSDEDKWRIAVTTACGDCVDIPKVRDAGVVVRGCSSYQVMHNGVRVLEDGYYGRWMTELIRLLRGHHEPQEEKVFYHVLKYISPGATMLELGSFWAYYSLWFQRAIAGARNIMLEPDPHNLLVGQNNFDLNGSTGMFIHASAGHKSTPPQPFRCESDGLIRNIPETSVDDLVDIHNISRVELLLADTQGAEFRVLQGATKTIEEGKLRFIFMSTHHHSISQDPVVHQRCLQFLRERNAHIIAEHSVPESFSGDGLIVASFLANDRSIPQVPISRNRASLSLFPESEFDLAVAYDENKRLRRQLLDRSCYRESS